MNQPTNEPCTTTTTLFSIVVDIKRTLSTDKKIHRNTDMAAAWSPKNLDANRDLNFV